MILSPIFAHLIQMTISRKREFLADATGALLTRYPEGLASALEKISANSVGQKMKNANHATAHMFISNPFGGDGKKNKVIRYIIILNPKRLNGLFFLTFLTTVSILLLIEIYA